MDTPREVVDTAIHVTIYDEKKNLPVRQSAVTFLAQGTQKTYLCQPAEAKALLALLRAQGITVTRGRYLHRYEYRIQRPQEPPQEPEPLSDADQRWLDLLPHPPSGKRRGTSASVLNRIATRRGKQGRLQ